MSSALVLVLAVALAYLAAHVAFDWLARRYLIVSGGEYLLLGILLGPQVSGVLSADVVRGFAPLTTLALGWIGTIIGTQFYIPGLVRFRGAMYRLAFFEALVTLGIVTSLELLVCSWLFGIPYTDAIAPALVLGAIATISAPSGIQMVTRGIRRRDAVVRQIEVTTAIDAFVAISAIGLLFCWHHPVVLAGGRPVTTTEWAVINIAIGLIGSALFHLFLGSDDAHGDRLFISLAGAVVLTSGAAAYLQLSPVLTAMVVGATLVNTSSRREEIARTLVDSERPFYFALLIFAGATWRPSLSAWWLVPVGLFLAARIVSKIGAARLGARLGGSLPTLGPNWGFALLGQGGLALAVGLDFLTLRGVLLPNLVFTAAIVSVLLTDVVSARFARSAVTPAAMGAPDARAAEIS